MVGADDLASVESNIGNLEALDYSYEPSHERLYPERRFFRKPRNGPHQYHLHCVSRDTEFYRDHVFFRNYLTKNPDVAGEYLALEKRLAETLRNDRPAYTAAKGKFIEAVLDKAMVRS